jgi:hypothetical protein
MKRQLIWITIMSLALALTATPARADIDTGLTGWWKLDETTGATLCLDSSGSGYNGTIEGSPTFEAGKIPGGNSMRCYGGTDGLNMGQYPGYDFDIDDTGVIEWTIALWLKRESGFIAATNIL